MIKQILLAGFAIFAMFFGSGNLVFPLVIGREAGLAWGYAAFGILVTGVLIPLAGLAGVILFRGDLNQFFKIFGRYGAKIVPFLILCLLGPFGVVPRCINVAYASFKTVVPFLALPIFSLIWCLTLQFLTPHREKIIPLIGRYFTPVKFCSLLILILVALLKAPALGSFEGNPTSVFWQGVRSGYQTMDLLAAFFFALSIIHYFRRLHQTEGTPLVKNISSALVGCSLLACVYFGFVYAGATYSPLIKGLAPEEILPTIAYAALGEHSGLFLNFTLVIACLTTSIALMSAFTDFLNPFLKKFLSERAVLSLSLAVTFLISTLEFKGIANFLSPVLDILYPFLIVLTIGNIIYKLTRKQRQPHA